MNLTLITIMLALFIVPTTYAIVERNTVNDYIHIITEFNHTIESSITKFNDSVVLLMLGFMISVSEQNQVNAEDDHIPLTAKFIYHVSEPTNTSSTHNSNLDLHITNDIQLQKQDSMINKHTVLSIQFDVNLYVGDNEE